MKVSRFAKDMVLLNCVVPVSLLGWDAVKGQLGANPVNFVIRTTGILSLMFLILSLAITPASRLTGQGQRSLKHCSGKDFQKEVFVPATTAAFHDEAVATGMLL